MLSGGLGDCGAKDLEEWLHEFRRCALFEIDPSIPLCNECGGRGREGYPKTIRHKDDCWTGRMAHSFPGPKEE